MTFCDGIRRRNEMTPNLTDVKYLLISHYLLEFRYNLVVLVFI